MSLHLFGQLTYSEEDWQIMEIAHIRVRAIDQPPASYEHNDRLARTIMKLFDQGTRDYQILAAIAAYREAVMVRRTSTHR